MLKLFSLMNKRLKLKMGRNVSQKAFVTAAAGVGMFAGSLLAFDGKGREALHDVAAVVDNSPQNEATLQDQNSVLSMSPDDTSIAAFFIDFEVSHQQISELFGVIFRNDTNVSIAGNKVSRLQMAATDYAIDVESNQLTISRVEGTERLPFSLADVTFVNEKPALLDPDDASTCPNDIGDIKYEGCIEYTGFTQDFWASIPGWGSNRDGKALIMAEALQRAYTDFNSACQLDRVLIPQLNYIYETEGMLDEMIGGSSIEARSEAVARVFRWAWRKQVKEVPPHQVVVPVEGSYRINAMSPSEVVTFVLRAEGIEVDSISSPPEDYCVRLAGYDSDDNKPPIIQIRDGALPLDEDGWREIAINGLETPPIDASWDEPSAIDKALEVVGG